MIYIKYIAIALFCSCFVNRNIAQNNEVKELLKKVETLYQTKEKYQVDVVYKMHRGLTGDNITESYDGLMVKNGTYSQLKVLNSEIITFPSTQLIINHESKKVIYSPVGKESTTQNSPLNVNDFLQYFNETAIRKDKGFIVCEMTSSKINMQNPYGKVVLYINEKNHQIEKQILFFSTLIPFAEKEGNSKKMDLGRLEITFKHKELKGKLEPKLTDFISRSSEDKIELSSKYSGYNLIQQVP